MVETTRGWLEITPVDPSGMLVSRSGGKTQPKLGSWKKKHVLNLNLLMIFLSRSESLKPYFLMKMHQIYGYLPIDLAAQFINMGHGNCRFLNAIHQIAMNNCNIYQIV